MLRTRRWWPLTAVEGTVALSGLVLVVAGVAVVAYSVVRLGTGEPLRMMIGWPHVDSSRAGVTTRSVSYSDPDTQQRLKDGLREKGIKHEVVQSDGKDFIVWNAAAGDAVREFMESRGSAECNGKVAAGKAESGRC